MDPRHIAEHLRFYAELGVTGISRDAGWRLRTEPAPSASVPLIWTLTSIREDIGDWR